jgi:tetratricopeptide (TPR) repeat protein
VDGPIGTRQMKAHEKLAAISHLEAAAAYVRQADVLLQNGESLQAIKALQQAREENNRAVSLLLGGCLETTLSTAQWMDGREWAACLPELTQLLDYALVELCQDCRGQIGQAILSRFKGAVSDLTNEGTEG